MLSLRLQPSVVRNTFYLSYHNPFRHKTIPFNPSAMSDAFESPPILTGKRKRTTVSYIEVDEDLDDVLSDLEEASDEESAVETDDDGTFGSRRKVGRTEMPLANDNS